MSWAALHTFASHFPLVLVVIGTLALLLAMARPRRGAWLYALATLTFAGICAYPAWRSGVAAGDMVRGAWYITPGAIERHATYATISLWALGAVGLVSLIAWASIARSQAAISPANWIQWLIALATLVALVTAGAASYFGAESVVESPVLLRSTPPPAPISTDSLPAGSVTPGTPGTSVTPQSPGATAPGAAAPRTLDTGVTNKFAPLPSPVPLTPQSTAPSAAAPSAAAPTPRPGQSHP